MPRSDKPRKIFKYKLFAAGGVLIPQGAEILSVQMQRGQPVFWALVDTDAPLVIRSFFVIGTGREETTATKADHIGTLQLEGGNLVLHVFEGQEKPGGELPAEQQIEEDRPW